MTANPPRWHADPTGRHELRYWDGSAWTEHVSDRGVSSTDRLDAGPNQRANRADDAHLMPSSEGRSTPATHDPVPVELPTAPTRTQAFRTEMADARRRPRPIITRAGLSGRTKLLIAFVAIDLVIAAAVIVLITR